MPTAIPDRALELRSEVTPDATVRLFLEEVDVARPGPGQVLVRVEAAPINPSDLGLLLAGADPTQMQREGTPERPVLTAPLPAAAFRAMAARVGVLMPAGNEGAGTVVAVGPDPDSAVLIGRTVALAGGSMYSQYRLAAAAECLVLPRWCAARDGASSFVNPMTVLGMIETMRAEGHTALVHTAAASISGRCFSASVWRMVSPWSTSFDRRPRSPSCQGSVPRTCATPAKRTSCHRSSPPSQTRRPRSASTLSAAVRWPTGY